MSGRECVLRCFIERISLGGGLKQLVFGDINNVRDRQQQQQQRMIECRMSAE